MKESPWRRSSAPLQSRSRKGLWCSNVSAQRTTGKSANGNVVLSYLKVKTNLPATLSIRGVRSHRHDATADRLRQCRTDQLADGISEETNHSRRQRRSN